MRLLMLGLDAAGKTSECRANTNLFSSNVTIPLAILYKLKLNQSVTTIPTGALVIILSSRRRRVIPPQPFTMVSPLSNPVSL